MDVMIVEAREQGASVRIETFFAVFGNDSLGDFSNGARVDADISDVARELRIVNQQDPVQSAIIKRQFIDLQ